MDGREAMAAAMAGGNGGGVSPYFMNGGAFRPSSSDWITGFPPPHSIFNHPNMGIPMQYPELGPLPDVNSGGAGMSVQGECVKRKRGRPRKYGPDGSARLGIPSVHDHEMVMGSCSLDGNGNGNGNGNGSPSPPGQKRGRGRPPGSGKKQLLGSNGDWISSSAGMGFTPHIIYVSSGEDIAAKIKSFAQQGPRTLSILSATGRVSNMTLRRSPTCTVNIEGPFEIVSLSGNYVVNEDDGSQERAGGLSICASAQDRSMVGGGVAGKLIAAGQVQVIVGSFICGSDKPKNKSKYASGAGPAQELPLDENQIILSSVQQQHNQDLNRVFGDWPMSRPTNIRDLHPEIDLPRR